jgi:hypothetical protein
VVGLVVLLVACGGEKAAALRRRTLRIGGLLSLTGGWASLGQTPGAVEPPTTSAPPEQIGSDLRRDRYRRHQSSTPTSPPPRCRTSRRRRPLVTAAVERRGTGDQADRRAAQRAVDQSTAHSLAVGDNIFRLCPDDEHEARRSPH